MAKDVVPDIDKVNAAFAEATAHVYGKGKFTPDMLRDKAISGLINAIYDTISIGVDKVSSSATEDLKASLKYDTFRFSGFKTFHEMKEVSFKLYDDSGMIRPYTDFKKEADAIGNEYNENWLRTECNLAAQSAESAAQWESYQQDGERYDLQYRTAGDDKVREAHRALAGVTLPASDPFWDNYYPPNGYNCRCTVLQVRKGKYQSTHSSADAIAMGDAMTEGKNSIFRYNPGKSKAVMPPKHPYYPTGCGDCEFTTRLSYDPNNQRCRGCIAIKSCYDEKFGKVDTQEWIMGAIAKHKKGEICGRAIKIADIDPIIFDYARLNNINIAGSAVLMTDKAISHSIRQEKKNRGAALSEKQIINTAENIRRANIYYDKAHSNFLYIIRDGKETLKYVLRVNYKLKISHKNIVCNDIASAGKIQEYNIKDARYIKIK